LNLKDGGKFESTWVGCLGVYGRASGAWSLQEDGLKLVAQKSEGMLEGRPIDRLRIFSLKGNYLLLQERDLNWYKNFGLNGCIFFQDAAREAVMTERRRWIEAMFKRIDAEVKELEAKEKK
jgi:hypothetical protein